MKYLLLFIIVFMPSIVSTILESTRKTNIQTLIINIIAGQEIANSKHIDIFNSGIVAPLLSSLFLFICLCIYFGYGQDIEFLKNSSVALFLYFGFYISYYTQVAIVTDDYLILFGPTTWFVKKRIRTSKIQKAYAIPIKGSIISFDTGKVGITNIADQDRFINTVNNIGTLNANGK